MDANHLFDGLLVGRESDSRTLLKVPDGKSWSYADLVKMSGMLANLLLEQNVQPGDRVAAQVQKSVETIALYLATIRAGAVFGIADADLGEAVAAAVVPVAGAELDPEKLIKALEPVLARFKLPHKVFVIDELPRNAMGKVQKNSLRDTYG